MPLVVIGLGNPGGAYAPTRHNAGYWVVDRLMQQPPARFRRRLFSSYRTCLLQPDDGHRPLLLVRYDGYMNRSGAVYPPLKRRLGITPEDVLVAVDNMDLPPGACRIRKGGGDAGHNGLKSLIAHAGGGGFSRLYIGVGRPKRGEGVVDHVLGIPDEQDRAAMDAACDRAARAVMDLRSLPFARVAETLNRRET